MGLADDYKERMKEEGQNFESKMVISKKDRSLYVSILVGVIVAIALYFLVSRDYSSCLISTSSLTSVSTSTAGAISNPFNTKCGLDVTLYGFTAGLVAFISTMATLKLLRFARKKRKSQE